MRLVRFFMAGMALDFYYILNSAISNLKMNLNRVIFYKFCLNAGSRFSFLLHTVLLIKQFVYFRLLLYDVTFLFKFLFGLFLA